MVLAMREINVVFHRISKQPSSRSSHREIRAEKRKVSITLRQDSAGALLGLSGKKRPLLFANQKRKLMHSSDSLLHSNYQEPG